MYLDSVTLERFRESNDVKADQGVPKKRCLHRTQFACLQGCQ